MNSWAKTGSMMPADDLAGEPRQRHRGAAPAAVLPALAEQRILGGIGGPGLGEPGPRPGGLQRLQLAGLDLQLLRGGTAAIDALALTFVPSPATTSTLTRPCFAHAASDATSSPFTAPS